MTTKAEQLVTKEEIAKLMLGHGFTIKEGQTDLKPYVYDAAYAIVQHVMSRYLPVGSVQTVQAKDVNSGVVITSNEVPHDQTLYVLATEAVPSEEPTAEEIEGCMKLFNTSPIGLPSLLRAYRNFCTAYDTVRILSSALNKAHNKVTPSR